MVETFGWVTGVDHKESSMVITGMSYVRPNGYGLNPVKWMMEMDFMSCQ